jgi:hypothetical protein
MLRICSLARFLLLCSAGSSGALSCLPPATGRGRSSNPSPCIWFARFSHTQTAASTGRASLMPPIELAGVLSRGRPGRCPQGSACPGEPFPRGITGKRAAINRFYRNWVAGVRKWYSRSETANTCVRYGGGAWVRGDRSSWRNCLRLFSAFLCCRHGSLGTCMVFACLLGEPRCGLRGPRLFV